MEEHYRWDVYNKFNRFFSVPNMKIGLAVNLTANIKPKNKRLITR